MNIPILEIKNLQVTVGTKTVIEGVNLTILSGTVTALVGNNGSGKSSLAMTLIGDPKYQVQKESENLMFDGKNLHEMGVDERSRSGIFLAWQSPVTIPGVSVFSLCKASFESLGSTVSELVSFKKELEKLAHRVGLPASYIGRSVNDGFSGGERKRLELLQLLLLKPKLAILDEIDSGMDADGVKILIDIVLELKKTRTSFILISHNKQLLNDIVVDETLEMKNGKLSTRI